MEAGSLRSVGWRPRMSTATSKLGTGHRDSTATCCCCACTAQRSNTTPSRATELPLRLEPSQQCAPCVRE